jgi:hypothetical protein
MVRPERRPTFIERHPVFGYFKGDLLNLTRGKIVYSLLTGIASIVFGYLFKLISSGGIAVLAFLCSIVTANLLAAIFFALRAPYRFIAEQDEKLTTAVDSLARQEKKMRFPILSANILEIHIVPFGNGADCFVRVEIRSDSEMAVRIMRYRVTLAVGEDNYPGRRANAAGHFLIDRSEGELDEDGDRHWTTISTEKLVNIADKSPVTRGDPLTGWLRFHFDGVPRWETFGEPIGYAKQLNEQTGEEEEVMDYELFFGETTAKGLTVTFTDSDGRDWESHSNRISCEQSRTVKKLRAAL